MIEEIMVFLIVGLSFIGSFLFIDWGMGYLFDASMFFKKKKQESSVKNQPTTIKSK